MEKKARRKPGSLGREGGGPAINDEWVEARETTGDPFLGQGVGAKGCGCGKDGAAGQLERGPDAVE